MEKEERLKHYLAIFVSASMWAYVLSYALLLLFVEGNVHIYYASA